MHIRLKQMLPKLSLLIFGFVIALLIIEIGFRFMFFSLPYPVQTMMSGARLWGIAGPPLGSLRNTKNFYETCVGDEHLSARLLPGLVEVPVWGGGQNIYHVTTKNLGFSDIGFRTSEFDGPWDGIVLGDSFGYCMGVELENCWVHQLEEQIGMRLANLSVLGTGSVSHLRYLEDYGLALEPKVIIWQYYVNDPSNDYSHVIEDKLTCHRIQPDSALIPKPRKPLQGLRDWLSHTLVTYNLALAPALRTLLPQLASQEETVPSPLEKVTTTDGKRFWDYTNVPSSDDQRTKVGMELTQDAILAASKKASENDILFLLVIAPSALQVYRDFIPASEKLVNLAHDFDIITDQLIAFAENRGIHYVDLRSEFRKVASQEEAMPLYLEHDSHWNPSGNTLAAEVLSDWFQQRSLVQ